jgi:MHS family proline/betaine transporter-like MFS transporter
MLLGIALTGAVLPLVLFPDDGAGWRSCFGGSRGAGDDRRAWSAVAAAATAEQFIGAARLSGLALGVTGNGIFRGPAPWGAQRLVADGRSLDAGGDDVALVAMAALPVIARMPETAPRLAER